MTPAYMKGMSHRHLWRSPKMFPFEVIFVGETDPRETEGLAQSHMVIGRGRAELGVLLWNHRLSGGFPGFV